MVLNNFQLSVILGVIFGALLLALVISAIVIGSQQMPPYYNPVEPSTTTTAITTSVPHSKVLSTIQCDCMDNLKQLFMSKVYFERLLMFSTLTNHDSASMTLERLISTNRLIGEALNYSTSTSVGSELSTLLNEWDALLLEAIASMGLSEDAVYSSSVKKMIAIEQSIMVLFDSLPSQEVLDLLATYRNSTLSQVRDYLNGNYAASFVDLDNASNSINRWVGLIVNNVS